MLGIHLEGPSCQKNSLKIRLTINTKHLFLARQRLVRTTCQEAGSELSDSQNGTIAIMFAGHTMLWETDITSHSMLWENEFRQSKTVSLSNSFSHSITSNRLPLFIFNVFNFTVITILRLSFTFNHAIPIHLQRILTIKQN